MKCGQGKSFTVYSDNPKMDTSGQWEKPKEYKDGGYVYRDKSEAKLPMDELPDEENVDGQGS